MLRPLLLIVTLALVFMLGVALGQVTSSDPEPDGPPLTTVRTIVPLAETSKTVTVTTTVTEAP